MERVRHKRHTAKSKQKKTYRQSHEIEDVIARLRRVPHAPFLPMIASIENAHRPQDRSVFRPNAAIDVLLAP